MKKIFALLICISILAACTPATELAVDPIMSPPPSLTETAMPMSAALWVSSAVPDDLRTTAQAWGIPLVDDSALATQKLDVSDSGALWMYALVAPFPTLTDDVTYEDLSSAWKGAPSPLLAGRGLLLAESTLRAFTALWGEPAIRRSKKRSVR